MGTGSSQSSRASRRGLASFVAFVLLFAFALASGSLMALAGGDRSVPSGSALPGAPAAAGKGAASVTRSAPSAGTLKTARATRDKAVATPAAALAANLVGGDVSLDFVAAGPFTYDHTTGLGTPPQFGYDNRTISKSNGVVESLEGGDFACGDLVTFFVQVKVAGDAAATGAVELDMSFGAETTGQPGLGFDDIVSTDINSPDGGNVGLDGNETAVLSNEHPDTAGYDEIKGTVTVSGLDGGETAIVRIIVHLACELNASPTGNILNAIDAARVVGDGKVSIGQETVPMKQVGGLQAAPSIEVVKDCPAIAPAGEAVTYEITVTNTGNVDLSNVTVVDDIIGDLSGQFPDTLAVGSDPVTVQVEYTTYSPGVGQDPVINTVTASGTGADSGVEASATASCSTDVSNPGISILKTVDQEIVPIGTTVTFTYLITNTGDVTLYDISVDDDILGHIGDIAQLDPGQHATLTQDFVVGDEIVTNVGTATGHDILGRVVSATDDATVAPIAGEGPPPNNPPTTPFTGSDAGRLGIITMILFGIGVTVVASTRRRRPKVESAQ